MPSDPNERTLDDVARALDSARERATGAVVLIGAGCSVSGGIPSAGMLCDHIQAHYTAEYARAERKGDAGYQALMAELSEGERRDLLSGFIDIAKINWAHIGLAALMKEGYVARVLTPNFDPLLVRACALLNLFPAVYDFAASQAFVPSFVPTPAIFYLHGQRTGFRLLNTDRECREHAERLSPVFDDAGTGRPWVVVGYSGANDPVYERLMAERSYPYRLFWVGRNDDDPGHHLTNRLFGPERFAHFVRGYDADTFFVRLADRLGCFPPALVKEPLAHLADTFDMIATYKLPDEDGKPVDLLEGPRKNVQDAIKQRAARETTAGADADDRALTEVRVHLMRGDYAAVLEAWQAHPEPASELVDLAASAFNGLGIELWKRAEGTTDAEETRRLFAESETRHAEAVRLRPTDYNFLNNWGVALSERAIRATDPAEAARLFEEAEAKYAEAVRIKPDSHETLNNWGITLLRRVALTEDPEAVNRLLTDAERVLLEAAQLNPGTVYDLACVYAWRGDAVQARRYLFQAKEAGTLPDRTHLMEDQDLAPLRETPWFTELLDGIA